MSWLDTFHRHLYLLLYDTGPFGDLYAPSGTPFQRNGQWMVEVRHVRTGKTSIQRVRELVRRKAPKR